MKLGSLNDDAQEETTMEFSAGWTDTGENRLDRIVARLAIGFMTVDRDHVGEAIDRALASLGQALGARGGAVVVLDEKQGTITRGHEWLARPAGVEQTCRRGTQIDCLLWFRERLLRGERIEIREPEDLPEEAGAERVAMDRRGIGSGVLVPISVGGRSVGFLAFAGRKQSRWSEDEVAFIDLAAELFGRLFERSEIEELRWARVRELERTSAELEDFAYQAAHDLKAPLTAIAGYLDILKRSYGQNLNDDAFDLIDRADRSAGRLNGLIDSLLVYSALGSEPLRAGKTDCQAIIEAICEDLELVMRERDATLLADPLPTVTADTAQLRRVFQNLIVNAIKFGGRSPRVRVGVAETEQGYEFMVSDEGPGIDPRDHARIFEPFERLATEDPRAGSGVGLAICKKIVEQHGGRIWVDSSLGAGAAFRFSLPRVAVAA